MNYQEGDSIPIPTLTNGKIILRPCVPDDLEAILVYRRDPECCRYIRPPDPIEKIAELVNQHCQPWQIKEGHWNGIIINLPDSNMALGEMVFRINDMENQRAELGYRVNPDYLGQGLASQAGELIIRYLFEEVGVHKIVARCDPRNVASSRVMQKIGMTQEGLFKSHFLIGDEWTDQLDFGILKIDWQKSNNIG